MAVSLGAMFVNVGANIGGLKKGLAEGNAALTRFEKKAGFTLKKVGASATRMGKTMTTRLTLPILGVGVAVLKMAGDFELAMNKVQALSGATGQELERMRLQAKQLGATTQFSASQAADAMGALALAGFKTEEIIGSMPNTLQLAAAAQIDLGQAAEITANILRGYGLDVSELNRANDTLVATFTNTKTNLVQLGQAMKFVGPVASTLGIEIEETAAALGGLAQAGLEGTLGGTSLRRVLSTLIKEGRVGGKLFKEFGVNIEDANGKFVGITEAIRQMEKAQKSATSETEFANKVMELFGLRGGPGLLNLLKFGSQGVGDLTAKIKTMGGITEKIAKVQMKGFIGQMRALKSAVEGMAIAIGEAGLLKDMTDFAKVMTTYIRNATDAQKETFIFWTKVAGLAAAIGPLLIVLGSLTTVLSTVIPLIITFVAVLLPLAGVLGIVALIGVALVGTTLALSDYGEAAMNAREPTQGLTDDMMAMGGALGTNTAPAFDAAADALKRFDGQMTQYKSNHGLVDIGLVPSHAPVAPTPPKAAGSGVDGAVEEIARTEAQMKGLLELFKEGNEQDFAALSDMLRTNVEGAITASKFAWQAFVDATTTDIPDPTGSDAMTQAQLAERVTATQEAYAQIDAAKLASFEKANELDAEYTANYLAANMTLGQAMSEQMALWAEENQITWTTVAENIMGIVDQTIAGISNSIGQAIMMGQNLGKAMQQVMKQVGASIISTLIKMGIQFVLSKILEVGVAATETSAKMAGLSAVTYGAAFASVVGYMGPAAAGYAAGMQALMLAGAATAGAAGAAVGTSVVKAAGVPSLAVGTDFVPADTPAFIHRGEAVLQAQANEKLTDFLDKEEGGGGGGAMTVILEMDGVEMTRKVIRNIKQGVQDQSRTLTLTRA